LILNAFARYSSPRSTDRGGFPLPDRRPTAPAFADETPQLIAVVELDEGPRLTTTLVNVAPDAVRIGMKLRPFFDDQAGQDITLLRYQPA
jgi:uncharacterized protein